MDGGRADDELYGGDNGDRLLSDLGNDWAQGGDGPDELFGQEHNDRVVGGLGIDDINGGAGDDKLYDGAVDESYTDTFRGGDDDDTIYSDNYPAHKDIVDCGSGTDKVFADRLDAVAADCEKVDRVEDIVKQNRNDSERVNRAVLAMERHMRIGADGQLKVDRAGLAEENISAADLEMLEAGMADTNRRIAAGEIKGEDVFPSSNVQPSTMATAQSGDFTILVFRHEGFESYHGSSTISG